MPVLHAIVGRSVAVPPGESKSYCCKALAKTPSVSEVIIYGGCSGGCGASCAAGSESSLRKQLPRIPARRKDAARACRGWVRAIDSHHLGSGWLEPGDGAVTHSCAESCLLLAIAATAYLPFTTHPPSMMIRPPSRHSPCRIRFSYALSLWALVQRNLPQVLAHRLALAGVISSLTSSPTRPETIFTVAIVHPLENVRARLEPAIGFDPAKTGDSSLAKPVGCRAPA